MKKKKILLIFGTRPEVIKLAPVYHACKKRSDLFEIKILVTAQHRDMLDQTMAIFDLHPEFDLNIMRENQDLFDVTVHALQGIKPILDEFKPDCVLVQGDTTSTFIGALSAYYKKIMVGHVEAGLRTYNKYSPFPEEINRQLTGSIADLHFAPTQQSFDNLTKEQKIPENIYITGNTSIDALLWVIENRKPDFTHILSPQVNKAIQGRFILVTSHRRESFGEPMQNTFMAISDIVEKFPEYSVVFPVHPNPSVRRMSEQILAGVHNVHLINPLDYVNFAHLMSRAEIVLTDSGGIQEEGPSLKKPILVLRNTTERPEGIKIGTAKLVGTDRLKIVREVTKLIQDPTYYEQMIGHANPYGDGTAAEQIVTILMKRLTQVISE